MYINVYHKPAFGQPLTNPADYLEHPDYWGSDVDEVTPSDDLLAELADQKANHDDPFNFSGAY